MFKVNNLAGFGRRRGGGNGYRYFRILMNDSWDLYFRIYDLRLSEDGGSTTFPPNMTSLSAPSPWVVSSNQDAANAWNAFDDRVAADNTYWQSTGDTNVYLQIDAGVGASLLPNYLFIELLRNSAADVSNPENLSVLASNTGDFTGEEVTLHSETGVSEVGLGRQEVTYTW